MQKRSSRHKQAPEDPNEVAFRVVQQAISPEPEENPDDRNPHAVALGRLGGLKGGKARAQKLTKKRRSEIARKAARARWAKTTPI
ncbi:MAG: hypothetical protein FJX75_26875 [Armatimonadetes bacterium]|nr:hypothetical protein [Armatimonadota bacterium]